MNALESGSTECRSNQNIMIMPSDLIVGCFTGILCLNIILSTMIKVFVCDEEKNVMNEKEVITFFDL